MRQNRPGLGLCRVGEKICLHREEAYGHGDWLSGKQGVNGQRHSVFVQSCIADKEYEVVISKRLHGA